MALNIEDRETRRPAAEAAALAGETEATRAWWDARTSSPASTAGLATARAHPSIMWEKFRMLPEGARLASRRLWT